MFGPNIPPKPPVLKPRPIPKPSDCFGDRAYSSGHFARDPNTQYNIKLMQYLQRKTEDNDKQVAEIRQKLDNELISAKYTKHAENKSFQRSLNEKVLNKLKEYDVKIDVRRKKLAEIIWKEERELAVEIVIDAQKGKERKIQERIEKIKKAKEKTEAERLELVKEKRLQQYVTRCAEFRPVLAYQRMSEAKQVQLIQMKENESRRQSEKELEQMWHEMKLKYTAAIAEREEQDRLRQEKLMNEFKYFCDLQIKEKMMRSEQEKQEKLEERNRMDKLKKQNDEEDRAKAEKQRRKKKELLEETKTQIKDHQDMVKRTTEKERKIQQAYDELADQEIAREKQIIKDRVSTGYIDMIHYLDYLAELKADREEEARILDEYVKKNLTEIQRADDDKRCKVLMAKKAFQELVLQERIKQIEAKKKKEEELQKAKEIEIELIKQSREHNEKLRREYDRQNILKAKKYAEALQQQIEYSRVLEERERENLRRILESAKIEDAMYDRTVARVLQGDIKICEVHAFRQVIEAEKCPCPKPNY